MRTCCGRIRKQVFFARKRTETASRDAAGAGSQQRTCEISGGWFPRRVLFFAVPPVDGKACQLCALTQIESGRCYLFTPDCTPILVYAIQGRKLYLPVRREEHHEAKHADSPSAFLAAAMAVTGAAMLLCPLIGQNTEMNRARQNMTTCARSAQKRGTGAGNGRACTG